jgi:trehalose 6-phosphate synthase
MFVCGILLRSAAPSSTELMKLISYRLTGSMMMVTPLRDGMNLVAKEGPLVNRHDGVLVLSTETGAWEELREVALGVHPCDVSATAEALAEALSLSAAEKS